MRQKKEKELEKEIRGEFREWLTAIEKMVRKQRKLNEQMVRVKNRKYTPPPEYVLEEERKRLKKKRRMMKKRRASKLSNTGNQNKGGVNGPKTDRGGKNEIPAGDLEIQLEHITADSVPITPNNDAIEAESVDLNQPLLKRRMTAYHGIPTPGMLTIPDNLTQSTLMHLHKLVDLQANKIERINNSSFIELEELENDRSLDHADNEVVPNLDESHHKLFRGLGESNLSLVVWKIMQYFFEQSVRERLVKQKNQMEKKIIEMEELDVSGVIELDDDGNIIHEDGTVSMANTSVVNELIKKKSKEQIREQIDAEVHEIERLSREANCKMQVIIMLTGVVNALDPLADLAKEKVLTSAKPLGEIRKEVRNEKLIKKMYNECGGYEGETLFTRGDKGSRLSVQNERKLDAAIKRYCIDLGQMEVLYNVRHRSQAYHTHLSRYIDWLFGVAQKKPFLFKIKKLTKKESLEEKLKKLDEKVDFKKVDGIEDTAVMKPIPLSQPDTCSMRLDSDVEEVWEVGGVKYDQIVRPETVSKTSKETSKNVEESSDEDDTERPALASIDTNRQPMNDTDSSFVEDVTLIIDPPDHQEKLAKRDVEKKYLGLILQMQRKLQKEKDLLEAGDGEDLIALYDQELSMDHDILNVVESLKSQSKNQSKDSKDLDVIQEGGDDEDKENQKDEPKDGEGGLGEQPERRKSLDKGKIDFVQVDENGKVVDQEANAGDDENYLKIEDAGGDEEGDGEEQNEGGDVEAELSVVDSLKAARDGEGGFVGDDDVIELESDVDPEEDLLGKNDGHGDDDLPI